MTHEKQAAAVARYRAMAGLIRHLPPKAARRAKRDQKLYAAKYVLRRRGCAACDPLRMVRFLVEVCGLTLTEASVAARAAVREGNCGALPLAKDSRTMAVRLYRNTRDVLEAVALARFYGWAADDPKPWEAVRSALSAMPVARESTGQENWS